MNKILDWDTNFFGFDVYRLDTSNETKINKFLKGIKSKSLIYVFTGKSQLSQLFCEKNNCKMVDTKIVFKKQLEFSYKEDVFIDEYESLVPSDDLIRLAYLSGNCSRFKLDERLPKGKFEELYLKWIENSIKDVNTKVFVFKEKEVIIGFVTLSIFRDYGQIGLIAVFPDVQGKGIGKRLISYCESYLKLNKNIDMIFIPTQKHNEMAMKFYIKLGYSVIAKNYIYHIIKE